MLMICLMITCSHDVVAHMFNSLIYFNMLPCYCFSLMHGCCELASTFDALTWRVMPDLQAVLWMRRTTFPVFTSQEVSQPVSLWIGVHHHRYCSTTVDIPLLELCCCLV